MTSSGICHKCEKIASKFHYNTTFKGNGHDGFWYCDEHGPENTKVFETDMDYSNKNKPLTAGMNRADRRYFERTGKIRK